MRISQVKRVLLGSGALFVLAATPVITKAVADYNHGGQTNTIHACVSVGKGAVRIVDAGEHCKQNEQPLKWNIKGPPGPAGSIKNVLSEIGLVDSLAGFNSGANGEISRFLWEPSRYDPAPSEIYFEVFAAANSQPISFWLQDLTQNIPIVGSELTTDTSGRLRTGNLVGAFPTTATELALMASTTDSYAIPRAAVLIQQ